MSNKYHTNLIPHLVSYGVNNLQRVTNVYSSGQQMIPIANTTPNPQIAPLYYNPDVQYYVNRGPRSRYYFIFEIADKQGTAQTIADILRVFLCNFTIPILFFIVPTKDKYDETDKTQKIIINHLKRTTGVGTFPFEIRIIMIARNKSNSQNYIYDKLDREVRPLI